VLRLCVVQALLVLAAACAGFGPPRAETLAALAPMPLAALVPGRFELELEAPGLTGTFDAVGAVVGEGVRLQLFPDVGGKLLDVQASAAAVTADVAGHRYEATAPLDGARPHVALVLAAAVAELAAPLGSDRVLGERVVAGGVELRLRPALGAGEVRAEVGSDGVLSAYRVRLGGVQFALHADGRLVGSGFAGRFIAPR
jgi:hypothetical protein